jgi:hypothetical protein
MPSALRTGQTLPSEPAAGQYSKVSLLLHFLPFSGLSSPAAVLTRHSSPGIAAGGETTRRTA